MDSAKKEFKDFEFLHLKNDNFIRFKEGDRLFNDIIKVIYTDKSKEYRIYLNNTPKNMPHYVKITYNDNNVMINEISHYTWTLDNISKENTNFVKSEADSKTLTEIIERYGLKQRDDLVVNKVDKCDVFNQQQYEDKRRIFKKTYEREWLVFNS